ncbi:MAG: hypothetical protein IPO92_22880 [Saprospiraceae bacterium]|nr:hypothetical protein [Saprospiraceae bacterium]
MSKVVKLSELSGKAATIYLEFMTEFWEEHDLYWQLSNGGFSLWAAYVDAGNALLLSEMKILAAAANLLIIEYNKDRILEEGHSAFNDHMTLLSSYYQIHPSEITKMSVKLKTSILKLSFDTTELEWDDEADESGFDGDDDLDYDELTPEMIKSGMKIMNKTCNFHVRIDFEKNLPFSKEQFTQLISDLLIDVKTGVPIKLYQLYFNNTDISFSIDCQFGVTISFIEMMLTEYKVTPEFVFVRDVNENAFIPDDHYVSFMEYYRDMVVSHLENEADLKKYIEKYTSLSAQERRKQNPNPREDDEYAALLLYDLLQEEGIENAMTMLKTNKHNIEAQILIAGWEGDLEKRIDLLEEASDIRKLDYDYKKIHKDKMWWVASHTRPFIRAKFLLAKTYELGGYIDDAVDGYKEIMDMNPNDNLGARLELIRLLYKIGDKKEIVSLVNKYPDEVDEYFSFAGVYAAFMKNGKSSKTEKKIIFSLNTNYYMACAIAKIDADQFTDFLDLTIDEDRVLFENFENISDNIMSLFKNAELLKYYRNVVKEIFDRIDN